jgi:hypothetical protein
MKLCTALMSLLILACSAQAVDNIETIKAKVQRILAQKNPQALAQYNDYSRQYDQLVLDFFDSNNHEPLKAHVNAIAEAMRILKETYNNPQFASVRPILMTYHKHGAKLVHELKQYIGSRNTIGLVLRLRHFVFLLPKVVRDKGGLNLLKGLHYRLRCV